VFARMRLWILVALSFALGACDDAQTQAGDAGLAAPDAASPDAASPDVADQDVSDRGMDRVDAASDAGAAPDAAADAETPDADRGPRPPIGGRRISNGRLTWTAGESVGPQLKLRGAGGQVLRASGPDHAVQGRLRP
jgi:hypothetical protein